MAEITLRAADAADIPAVLELWRRGAENASRPSDTARAVEELITRDPEALILAVRDSALVGTVIAGWDGWRCRLYRLAVAPECRGQGVARLLVEAAEHRFRQFGGGRIEAMVLDDNTLAQHAWRALGYEPQAEWSRWIKPLPATPGHRSPNSERR